MRIALLMMLMAGLSGAYAAPAGDLIEEPSVRLTCHAFMLESEFRPGDSRSWDVLLAWKVETPALWNIVWSEENKALVTVQDAAGNKAGASDVSWDFYNARESNKEGSLKMSSHCWLPAVGAQWVDVKGEVPFAVSRQDVMTEPVTVKLIKGFSVPVVLKGAGLAGEDGKPVDVKATLKVRDYESVGEKDKKWMNLELSTNKPVGLRKVELQTAKGQPMYVEERIGGMNRSGDSCFWVNRLEIDSVPEGEVEVMIGYANEPQMVKAVVDSRVALSGFGNGKGSADGEKARARMTPASVVAQPGSGKTPAVKAELEMLKIGSDFKWVNKVRQESPLQMSFHVRLEAKGPAGFGDRASLEEQNLEVTDSTGRVLSPAVFDLRCLSPETNNGVSRAVVGGKSSDLASPGAEWVRVKGTLRVPMVQMKESPVYELPLAKGSELHVPVPGLEENGDVGGDLATAGNAPICKLWLKKMNRSEDQAHLEICLQVEGGRFDFDGFELVDAEGKPLNVDSTGSGSSYDSNNNRWEWQGDFTIRQAAEMQQLRVKVRYKEGEDLVPVPVPVDVTVGLGGPVSRKADGAGKGGNAGNAGKGKH